MKSFWNKWGCVVLSSAYLALIVAVTIMHLFDYHSSSLLDVLLGANLGIAIQKLITDIINARS